MSCIRAWQLVGPGQPEAGQSGLSNLAPECVSSSRRIGEALQKIEPRHVKSLRSMSTKLAPSLAPIIVKHRDHVPLILVDTKIDVHGNQFEEASRTHSEY